MTNLEQKNDSVEHAPEKEINRIIIKTTLHKSEDVEKEIPLPYFSKQGRDYFKILSEKETIAVWISSPDTACIARWILESKISEAAAAEPCTEQDFNNAFCEAQKIINT